MGQDPRPGQSVCWTQAVTAWLSARLLAKAPPSATKRSLRLWGEVKAAVGDRGAVIANTGNYSTWDSINLSREAEEVGVDALLLDSPLLQQAPPGGHLPALQGNRRINPSALHPLQHPRPHRHQDVLGDDHPGQPRGQHRRRERRHRRLRVNGANHRRRFGRLPHLERQ